MQTLEKLFLLDTQYKGTSKKEIKGNCLLLHNNYQTIAQDKVIDDCSNSYYNDDDPRRSGAGRESQRKSFALQLLERPWNKYLNLLVFDSTPTVS
jgi:hypothetical protein